MLLRRINSLKISLVSLVFLVSCASSGIGPREGNLCMRMKTAEYEELNAICQSLLDNGIDSIDTLLICLEDKADLKSPHIKLLVQDHWEGQIYNSPKKVCDLSLTLISYILDNSKYSILQNSAAIPIDDETREAVIREFLDWYNTTYKRE